MGGQNHQPTSRTRLIAPSAWLSQCVGDGLSHVLQANSELEKAIIVGMERLHVENFGPPLLKSSLEYMDGAMDHLRASLNAISLIQAAYSNLLEAAKAENYRGNPLASKVGSYALSSQFSGGLVVPAVNPVAWAELERRVAADNILETLAWEAREFDSLREPMIALIDVLDRCRNLAKTDGARAMVEAIECNQVPLRQRFAPVFSLWNHLHAMFLYSALIMTELFYLTNSLGTLTREQHLPRVNTA